MAVKYRAQSHLKLFKNIHSFGPEVKFELGSVLSFVGNLLTPTVHSQVSAEVIIQSHDE